MATPKNNESVDPQEATSASAEDPQGETPGGRYLVNGKLVDANGKPIGAKAEDGE